MCFQRRTKIRKENCNLLDKLKSMEDKNIHSKIIKQVCKEILIPLGVFQKGSSRLYLDDNDYFFTVVEFQPSSWDKGTYLNIGLTFLWDYNQSDVLYFDFSRKPAARFGLALANICTLNNDTQSAKFYYENYHREQNTTEQLDCKKLSRECLVSNIKATRKMWHSKPSMKKMPVSMIYDI